MVGVFVGDENGGEIFRRASDAGEALPNLARAEPGIHKYPRLSGFDIGAIPAGTAAKNGKFGGHRPTLVSGAEAGNFFRRGEFDFGHYLSVNYSINSHCFYLEVERGLLLTACANRNKDCVRRNLTIMDCVFVQRCALC